VSQDEISWLKDLAQSNMSSMRVTFEVSRDEISWLKDSVFADMSDMFLASDTSHPLMVSWELELT